CHLIAWLQRQVEWRKVPQPGLFFGGPAKQVGGNRHVARRRDMLDFQFDQIERRVVAVPCSALQFNRQRGCAGVPARQIDVICAARPNGRGGGGGGKSIEVVDKQGQK